VDSVLGLQRIADSCDAENTASARVMEKCGFQFEGEQDGERRYGLSAAAWQAR
jgi:RimJ/RimL family protein N-acetyltransferase